ncbi:MAG: glucosamine-6-phosphate deaminase [Verrucomicrobia bacterium]|nr:glucosamine-6-phosphate deaminase [Verrucomicrobiota bacterium]
MEVIIQGDASAAARLVALIIEKQVKLNPYSVLGLATGRTMEMVYEMLVNGHHTKGTDFSLVRTFNLDEYVGLSADDANSYRSYMNRRLFGKINIDMRNTFIPNGMAADLPAECLRYERQIRHVGGIDMQLLGIGQDGHIGFNEPLSALRSVTRVKALTPDTIRQNGPLFGHPDMVPRRAITMGVGTILETSRCLMLVTGMGKAEILQKAIEGPISSMVTASALQLHPHCTVICDEAAAANLDGKDYYRWIFMNEPEWEDYRKL